jgi:ABC-type antimicrobial peptide transport system permease subunit
LALALTSAGLFSIVSYGVAQRTTEFGIRTALGAPRIHILWVATRAAVVSVAAGVSFGLVISFLIQTILSHWTGSAASVGSLWSAIALLMFCSLVACALPARRAASIQPIEALRYE